MSSPLISLTVPELAGGIGRNIVNLANEFCSMGYRVDILLDKSKGGLKDLLNEKVGLNLLKTSHPVGGLCFLAPYLLHSHPQVVLTPVVRHAILAVRARRITLSSTRVFAEVHNTYSKTFQLLKMTKRSSRIEKIRKYYPMCDGIITVSDGVARDFSALTGIPENSLNTIYNPIVTPELKAMAKEVVDHPWFKDRQHPVILGMGRIVKAKNFPLLIDAFEILREKIDCRCLIIGDGPQKTEVELRAKASRFADDIQMLGHTENPFAYMKQATVFALTSSWEGFGNVLVEAMATGTPVVSTDCPHGPREILKDGKYGPLVPVGDAISLAEAIYRTLLNPPSVDLMIQASDRFNVRTIAEKYLKLFDL
jgi:glycosyltransferase involved in cell wall biosynthesis